jgi:hypothetical protein
MRQFYRLLGALALIGGLLGFAAARAETAPQGIGLAVADFSFLDTSGEPADQAAVHARRLEDFMASLRQELAADGRFRLLPVAENGGTPEALLQAAAAAGAKYLVIGGIHKMSTLVQFAKVDAIDIAADRVVFSKLFTFRGDDDQAWTRAESFVSQDLRAAMTPTSIKLAIFDFEYEDFSPAAASSGATEAEFAQLDATTGMVRDIFVKSGRYSVIDAAVADAPAVKARSLRDCNGCDAAIALGLGADQSFVGVVRRISRTEYTVRFQIRDAKTGTVLADENSGLRMGADYSWSRGARRLVLDRLLEKQQP